MQALITYVVDQIFKSGYGDDSEAALSACFYQLKAALSNLDQLAYEYRSVSMTDKRREAVNEQLSLILYYTCAIVHLLQREQLQFDLELLTEFAEQFHPDYHQDALLCLNMMMGYACTLMEHAFDHPSTEEVLEKSVAELPVETGGTGMVTVLSADEESLIGMPISSDGELEEDSFEFDENEIDQNLASIFAGVIILANKFDTDLGIVIYNSGILEGI